MTLNRTPLLTGMARRAKRIVARGRFTGSADYWERRYSSGGNSGAGSYGRLAEFKASFLNEFVAANTIRSVLELGCGDGAQVQLARYPAYTGIDVAPGSVQKCRHLFEGDHSKVFEHSNQLDQVEPHELGLSLDVVYHLVEDEVYDRYLTDLFRLSTRFVVIYSSNHEDPAVVPHIRHRRFTDWTGAHAPAWTLVEVVPNPYPGGPEQDRDGTSFADFHVFRRDAAADDLGDDAGDAAGDVAGHRAREA